MRSGGLDCLEILLAAFASAFPRRSQPCKNNENAGVNDLFDSSLTLFASSAGQLTRALKFPCRGSGVSAYEKIYEN